MAVIHRDVTSAREPGKPGAGAGEMYVAVIGIDRYRAWGRLHNAVRDAEGARDAFVALGFKAIGPQLFDEAATGAALRRLVTDDLRGLGTSDSLVLFFAGHGYTTTMTYPDGAETPVHVQSASLGDPIPAGATRHYQVYYRDSNLSFCPGPAGNTFNVSQAVAVIWGS